MTVILDLVLNISSANGGALKIGVVGRGVDSFFPSNCSNAKSDLSRSFYCLSCFNLRPFRAKNSKKVNIFSNLVLILRILIIKDI